MPAPTFVSDTETVWNTKTKPKTVSMTTDSDDVVVVLLGNEEDMMTVASDHTVSGTLSWTQYENVGANSRGRVGIWGAPGAVASGWTLTGTHAGDTTTLDKWFGFNALRFSGAELTGAAAESRDGAGVKGTIAITTTAANSAIAVICVDWSAIHNATRDWTSPQAGNGTELTYFNDSGHYTVYVGYYPDAGAAGSKTVGCLVGAGGNTTLGGHTIGAIEIKGGGPPPDPPPAGDRSSGFPLLLPYQLGSRAAPSPPSWNPNKSAMLTSFF